MLIICLAEENGHVPDHTKLSAALLLEEVTLESKNQQASLGFPVKNIKT